MNSEVHQFFPKMEYAFSIEIKLGKAFYLSPSQTGQTRVAVYVDEGKVSGKLNGRVVPMSGGDWALAREDKVLDFDARYLLELDDGTIVYLQNRGFRWGSEAAMKAMKNQQPVNHDEYYMRVTPKFDVQAGPHDWLNKYIFVGIAEKIPHGNNIHYFQVL